MPRAKAISPCGLCINQNSTSLSLEALRQCNAIDATPARWRGGAGSSRAALNSLVDCAQVMEAYFAAEPRDVEDDCDTTSPATTRMMRWSHATLPVSLLSISLLGINHSFVDDNFGTKDKIRVIELLLTRGADPNRPFMLDGWCVVPLFYAVPRCEVNAMPQVVKLLLEAGADARVMNRFERNGRPFSLSMVGVLLASCERRWSANAGSAGRQFKNHLKVLKMLLRAGASDSIDTCKAFLPGDPAPEDPSWIPIKAIVDGVRREGSWKAYCRVEHKRLIRLRSYLVRGYAGTTDARVDRILRLPNGACWKVLAYWREAA